MQPDLEEVFVQIMTKASSASEGREVSGRSDE